MLPKISLFVDYIDRKENNYIKKLQNERIESSQINQLTL